MLEEGPQALVKPLPGSGGNANRLGNRHGHEVGISQGGQRNEDGPIVEGVRDTGRDLNREPGLAGAAWTRDRDKPHIGAFQQSANRFDVALPADETGERARKVNRPLDREGRPERCGIPGHGCGRQVGHVGTHRLDVDESCPSCAGQPDLST